MNKKFTIGNQQVGEGCKPYIIAEISGNHNGDLNKALGLIDLAKDFGADAVKIQTYTADTMTIDSDREDFKITGGPWDGYSLYQLYKWAYTPWEWHKALFERAKEVGITLFSSPFDETAVDFLEQFDPPAYKVASFELVDTPLIEKIASTGKPMIMSTGMANQEEIQEAIDTAKNAGVKDLVVLHCVSGYPTPAEEMNLNTITTIAQEFGTLVGLSDHTLTTSTAIASVALGVSVIEKHFIESREDKGPDSDFSLEPHEFKQLVSDVETVWKGLGKSGFEHKNSEKANVKFRRSIYFVKDMKEGEEITEENIKRIRPGYGLKPKYFKGILGRKVNRDIQRGEPVLFDAIVGGDSTP